MTIEVCPYCRSPIVDGEPLTVCEGCGTRHHADCFAENSGCTIFGCKCAPAEEPKLSVSTPELASVATSSTPAVSTVRAPLPPPPLSQSAPASTEELQQIANRVVPSMFGAFLDADLQTASEPNVDPPPLGPPKNRTTYIVLGALLGALGAHNFYAGYHKKGAIQLAITALTVGFGTPMSWIWAIIDICTIEKDSHGVQFES